MGLFLVVLRYIQGFWGFFSKTSAICIEYLAVWGCFSNVPTEHLSERHFILRVAHRVAPSRVAS